MAAKVEPFWMRKTLAELDAAEWESLCDGCGLCCLQKLEDEEDGSVYYTRIACKLLDLKSCRCTDYPNRRASVPDCVQLTAKDAAQFKWLPPTCGYRLVAEGKDLPLWHHLVCGDPDAVHAERISQSGRMIAEGSVADEDWEDHLIFRAGWIYIDPRRHSTEPNLEPLDAPPSVTAACRSVALIRDATSSGQTGRSGLHRQVRSRTGCGRSGAPPWGWQRR